MAGGVALFPPPPPPPGLQFAISRLPHLFIFLRPTYHCKQVVNRRGGCKKGSINLGWKKGGEGDWTAAAADLGRRKGGNGIFAK